MKNFRQTAAVLTTLGAVMLTATPAMAQETNQDQTLTQDCEVVCEVGAYGQNTTCSNRCSQEGNQSQSITLSNGTIITAHEPVDTGLDIYTKIAFMALFSTGASAVVARKKLVK